MEILSTGGANQHDWLVFVGHYNESHFLFHRRFYQLWRADIPEYLKELMNNAANMQLVTTMLEDHRIRSDEKDEWANKKVKRMEYFGEQGAIARKQFGDYLRMD